MSGSLVSVVIPCYNSEKYIAETLDSVIAQSWKDIEIIVVDDGSGDGTVQIIRQYEKKGVICLTQQNKGACAARNLGYKFAKGEFIQFLDSDDPISSDKIENQLNILLSFKDFEQKMVHCQWGRFIESKDKVYSWGPDASIRKNLQPIDWLVANHMSMTGCWLVPRVLIEKAGLWDERLKRNQDGEFFSRVMLQANEILYCDAAKVYYRSGNIESISNTKSRPAMESLFISFQLIEKYMLSLEVSKRVKVSLANNYQDFVYTNYIAYPDLAALAENRVKALGGSELKLPGGFILRSLANLLGWKKALTIKKMIKRTSA